MTMYAHIYTGILILTKSTFKKKVKDDGDYEKKNNVIKHNDTYVIIFNDWLYAWRSKIHSI